MTPPREWWVYIIRADDGSLYTGVTTDPTRRFDEHCTGRGAKYFRVRVPVEMVYREGGHDRSSACAREHQIKSLPRPAKIALIETLGSAYRIPALQLPAAAARSSGKRSR